MVAHIEHHPFPKSLDLPLILYLISNMIDLKKRGNKRLVYKLFKAWPRKTRVKKSSVKWKCGKEIIHLVHNYSVTGREPRKNVLKINLLLL